MPLGQAKQEKDKKRFSVELPEDQHDFLENHSRSKGDIVRKALDKVKKETEQNGGSIREVLPENVSPD